MASGPITSWQIDGETIETVTGFIFLGSKITVDSDCSHEIKMLAPWKESYDKSRQHIKKQRHHFADKGPHSQSYGSSSSHVRIWELNHKEDWALKNWCFQIVLEKILKSPLDCKEIKSVNPIGNQLWMFIGRTWLHDAKNWLIGRHWCWGRLRAGRKAGDRGWDGQMVSLIQRTWVWANSGI